MVPAGPLKLLKEIEDFGQEILKNHSAQDEFIRIAPAQLAWLQTALAACASSDIPAVSKLSSLGHLLSAQMTPRHFMNFLVPVERALSRDLKDTDFLVSEWDAPTVPTVRRPLVFILENLRSSFNVGSIFRLADGLAVEKICLCGYTPTPDVTPDDAASTSGRTTRGGLGKAALGSDKSVPYQSFATSRDAILELRSQGYRIVALETSDKALPLFNTELPEKTAILVGNERFGVDHDSLALVDQLVKLPLHGFKNSLNVATALTAAAFEWTRQYESHRTLPVEKNQKT